MKKLIPLDHVIVALDGMNQDQILNFLDSTNGAFKRVKVGMEAFYKEGADLLRTITQKHHVKIFLDLKLHDIPNTVKGAIRSLKGLPVEFLTVHLSGGENMLKAAVEEAKTSLPACHIVGVSYLTSLSSEDFDGIWGTNPKDIDGQFNRLFSLGDKSGVDHFVLSPKELPLLKGLLGDKVKAITPGIRLHEEIRTGKIGDQSRVETPESALQKGASFLVVGRSITQAEDPTLVINSLKNELTIGN